jgi:hypothetical protein
VDGWGGRKEEGKKERKEGEGWCWERLDARGRGAMGVEKEDGGDGKQEIGDRR